VQGDRLPRQLHALHGRREGVEEAADDQHGMRDGGEQVVAGVGVQLLEQPNVHLQVPLGRHQVPQVRVQKIVEVPVGNLVTSERNLVTSEEQ
jgi:hypothetical protein